MHGHVVEICLTIWLTLTQQPLPANGEWIETRSQYKPDQGRSQKFHQLG